MSKKPRQLDIAHIMFLEMIGTFIKNLGAATAKGTLMRDSVGVAANFPEMEFASMDEFTAAIDDLTNTIAQVEGKAVHLGDGLFGLPKCPFANSIGNFTAIHGKLPDSFKKVPEDFNRPHPVTKKLRVGHGAGVSPFCAIHQPLRSALGARVKIAGKPIEVHQLGCKAGNGTKALADDLIKASGFNRETVEKVLDDNMCCYAVKLGA